MKKCSYCGETQYPLTLEHIIPSWYYKENVQDSRTFSERAKPNKLLKSEIKIKDVCEQCNNVDLSKLDQKGKELFVKFFKNQILFNESQLFIYNYGELARWLLKISYNSARSNGNDLSILSQYKEVILGKRKIPKSFFLRGYTIFPIKKHGNKILEAKSLDEISFKSEWFRIGSFRVNGFYQNNWAFRHITINSYCFLLYIPNLYANSRELDAYKLKKNIKDNIYSGKTINKSGRTKIFRPTIDAYTHIKLHMDNNPITYGLHSCKTIESFMRDDKQIGFYIITKNQILENDIDSIMDDLNTFISSRESCLALKDKMDFFIEGYNEDKRELYEIIEVVEFLRNIDERWPYWGFFLYKESRWLKLMVMILLDRTKEKQTFSMQASNILRKWYEKLNLLANMNAFSDELVKYESIKIRNMIIDDKM